MPTKALSSLIGAVLRRTRQQQLTKLLRRKSGASVAQMQKAFGWQPHTARAAAPRGHGGVGRNSAGR